MQSLRRGSYLPWAIFAVALAALSTPMLSTPAFADAPAEDAATPDPRYKIAEAVSERWPQELREALLKVRVAPPPQDKAVPDTARVRLQTSQGPITVELNGKAAPLHVKSFLYLTELGFYNGTQFHRYEPGFVIQGGDPLSREAATREYSGVGGPGYMVPREKNNLKHEAMVIAAARSQDPNSAGSQFYFTLEPAGFLDDGDGYTVFGKVIDGKENVLKLRQGATLEEVVLISGNR